VASIDALQRDWMALHLAFLVPGGAMRPRAESETRSARPVDIHVQVPARPAALSLPLARAALIVVDMQNGYGSPGGYREIIGRNIDGVKQVTDNNVRVIEAARAAGITVIFLQNGWDAELKNAGGPDSPNWHKSNPLRLMRERPELKGKILTHGSWDFEFVPAIVPRPEEIIVPKARYSGFCGTELDNVLRARNIRHLIVTGLTSNVCVESTIREAYHREYFCLLVEDATQQSGQRFVHDAVVYNIETFFGWVTSTRDVCSALEIAASTSI
jgi:ureidoacrylate peracid hydrolase